jgi:hypothetical protein
MPSEAEFLAQQSRNAKLRFVQGARGLGEDLAAPLQLRPWIRSRPWWSLGGATALGFVASFGFGGRRHRHAASAPGDAGPPPAPSKTHELLASLGLRARRILTSALGAALVTGWRGFLAPAASVATPPAGARRDDAAPPP